MKRRPATPPLREESKDPEPTPEPAAPEEERDPKLEIRGRNPPPAPTAIPPGRRAPVEPIEVRQASTTERPTNFTRPWRLGP